MVENSFLKPSSVKKSVVRILVELFVFLWEAQSGKGVILGSLSLAFDLPLLLSPPPLVVMLSSFV